MDRNISETVEDLSNYIQVIIDRGSGEELQLLPELVNSLAVLMDRFYSHF